MKKATTILCLVFVMLMVLALPVSAASPYYTYTYSIAGEALRSPDAYVPDREVNAAYMGLNDVNKLAELYPELSAKELEDMAKLEMSSLVDIETDENKNVYIVDRDNSRVIVLDPYYKLKFVISSFKDNVTGNIQSLKNPEGVFVAASKTVNGKYIAPKLYICDTGNSRILTFDTNGNYIREIGKPQSELIDTTSVYSPVGVAVDKYDRLYVVDRNSISGIVVMTEQGEFTGYSGAQKVTISFFDKLWRRFQTEEQRAISTSSVSTAYNNISLAGDFIYVTITLEDDVVSNAIRNKSKSGDSAPVKMLNAAGFELMRRNGFYPPSGEVDFEGAIAAANKNSIDGPSTVVDVAVGPEDTWSIVDKKRSKVFTYDFDGNLLFAFGDSGDLLGNIADNSLNAIVYQDTAMLLLDGSNKGSFTVYQRTEYGDVLIRAIENQNNRRYDEAINDWTEVLKRNSNFDAAYIGIGKALYRNHDYKAAVEQYKNAYDTENYSIAYSEIRQQWISKYLWTLPILIFVICFALVKASSAMKKANKKAELKKGRKSYGQELIYAFHVMLHPFDGFWDLKHEKRGSVRAGTTILAVTIAAFYYQSVGAGYVSNPQKNYISLIGAVLAVGAPLALWIIGNWCLTTLADGEGSLKDIYIASTYSLLPLILTIIPATIISNFVVASEAKFVSFIATLGFVWLGLLIFFGMMVTHDYSIGKNVFTILGTVLAMVFIMFLAILFSTLLGKLVGFIANIITELRYRM